MHRDIKPSNIMLCEQGGIPDFVKVLDFGLARTVERRVGHEMPRKWDSSRGRPTYLAPERITDPTTVDPRSDIYSFGAVGYYLSDRPSDLRWHARRRACPPGRQRESTPPVGG